MYFQAMQTLGGGPRQLAPKPGLEALAPEAVRAHGPGCVRCLQAFQEPGLSCALGVRCRGVPGKVGSGAPGEAAGPPGPASWPPGPSSAGPRPEPGPASKPHKQGRAGTVPALGLGGGGVSQQVRGLVGDRDGVPSFIHSSDKYLSHFDPRHEGPTILGGWDGAGQGAWVPWQCVSASAASLCPSGSISA